MPKYETKEQALAVAVSAHQRCTSLMKERRVAAEERDHAVLDAYRMGFMDKEIAEAIGVNRPRVTTMKNTAMRAESGKG